MALPTQVAHPTKTVTLPLTKIEVKYRPFLVKEEKILIMLRESDEAKVEDYVQAIGDVVTNCTFNSIDIMSLPSADLEYLFLKIRSASKGNLSKLTYRCKNVVDEKVCGTLNEVVVDLDTIEPTENEGLKTAIPQPGTDLVVHFNYPDLKVLKKMTALAEAKKKPSKLDVTELMFTHCFKMVTQGEKVMMADSAEEIAAFMNELSDGFFDLMQTEFIDKMPKLQHDLEFKCSKCGYNETIHLEGLQDFF